MSWKSVEIGSICQTTQGVQIAKQNQSEKATQGYIQYLYIADFMKSVSPKYVLDQYPAKVVSENDLVMANTGSPGKVFKGQSGVLSNNLFKISFDSKVITRDFLYNILASDSFQEILQSQMKQGIQRHLGHKTIARQKIPLPPLETQKKIVDLLDRAQGLIDKRKEQLQLMDSLTQSLFYDMFGDPVTNPMGWEQKTLGSIGAIQTGNTPSRKDSSNYGSHIEWIKTDNITPSSMYVQKAKEKLSQTGENKGRVVDSGAILVCCIAGSLSSIGKAALTDRRVAFNQQINSFTPDGCIDKAFALFHFKFGQKIIQNASTNSMKGMINKSAFSDVQFLAPPIDLQNLFAERVEKIDAQKTKMTASLKELEDNFNSLMQRAFKGELDL